MDREDLILELADEMRGTGIRIRPEKYKSVKGKAGERGNSSVEFFYYGWSDETEVLVDGWNAAARELRDLAGQIRRFTRRERNDLVFTVKGDEDQKTDFFTLTLRRDADGIHLVLRVTDDDFPDDTLLIAVPGLSEAGFEAYADVFYCWSEAFPAPPETEAPSAAERSCGAVVFTRTERGIRYVIVESLEGIHGFPKGHAEPGETERETALREIREETGLEVRLLEGFRAEDEYALPKKPGTVKRVVYFLGECNSRRPEPQRSELLSVKLLSFDEAAAVLEYESSRRILREADKFLHG